MSNLTFRIIPSLKTIKILSQLDEFEKWMSITHPEKGIHTPDFFQGYLFAITCCLNAFTSDLAEDDTLKIENDFLLNCALEQIVPLHQLPNSCEKIVLLKNLKPIIKEIHKANNFTSYQKAFGIFDEKIISLFDRICIQYIDVSPEISIDKETALKLLMIDFAHTFLIQIKPHGPAANCFSPLSAGMTESTVLEKYLDGYKYIIQFLWYKLVGETVYNNTHLAKLHEADSWDDYIYTKTAIDDEDDLYRMLNREFNLSEQTNFDSYFYWIIQEITDPLSQKHNLPVYNIDNYFTFNGKLYNKADFFEELLDRSKLKNERTLTWEQKIEECLYWHQYELVDSDNSHMFFGVSSFNTMLAGTIALKELKSRNHTKTIIVKFTHPHLKKENKNDYSYGILIDTKSAADHYSDGWVIYQNACGDYSGFSGSEYRKTEALIKKYKKKIDLRELTISLDKFIEITQKNTRNQNSSYLDLAKQNKLKDIVQKSRAYLFELFTYQLCVQYYGNDYHVKLNADRSNEEGEKDVLLIKKDNREVILIECKLNPQNNSLDDMVDKAKKKLKSLSQERKHVQFWFWHDLSPQNKMQLKGHKINNNPIETIIVSNPGSEKILKGVSTKLLKYIMNNN